MERTMVIIGAGIGGLSTGCYGRMSRTLSYGPSRSRAITTLGIELTDKDKLLPKA